MPNLKCAHCGAPAAREVLDIASDARSGMCASGSDKEIREALAHHLLVTLAEVAGFCPVCAELQVLSIKLETMLGVRT